MDHGNSWFTELKDGDFSVRYVKNYQTVSYTKIIKVLR